MKSQKEVKSKTKQSSCKKSVQPQEGHCEKRCEIQGGSKEMAVMVQIVKFLMRTIQVNLVLNLSETNSPVIKIFAISLQSQPSVSCHLGLFSQWPSCGHTHFSQLGCFGLDTHFKNTL